MKLNIFRRPKQDSIASLYGTIVAQARSPIFYRAYGVPDTTTGRLEMILLHTFLFCRRMQSNQEVVRILGQRVFDLFCSDMDGNLREMGVGDLAVPRQMQQIGEAFYGRSAVYEPALAAGNEQRLAEALMRNVFSSGAQQPDGPRRLVAYVIAASRNIAGQEDAGLVAGKISFPDPNSFLIAA